MGRPVEFGRSQNGFCFDCGAPITANGTTRRCGHCAQLAAHRRRRAMGVSCRHKILIGSVVFWVRDDEQAENIETYGPLPKCGACPEKCKQYLAPLAVVHCRRDDDFPEYAAAILNQMEARR